MAAASIVGSVRPFQLLLVDRTSRPLWLSRIGELLSDWVILVALFVLVFRITQDIAVVGLFMLARVLPRAAVVLWCSSLTARLTLTQLTALSALRVPLVASLVLVSTRGDLWWAGAVVLAIGTIAAISDASRATLLPCVVPRTRLAPANALNVAVERVCFVIGPVIGALILSQWNIDMAFWVAAAVLLVASGLLLVQSRVDTLTPPALPRSNSRRDGASIWSKLRERPVMLTLVGALFSGAVVAIGLKVALIGMALGPLDGSEALYGIMLAIVALGMFAGPISIPRLMGRLPVALFATASVGSLAVGMAAISQLTTLLLVAPILFLIGLFALTNDMIAMTTARRFTREEELLDVARMLVITVVAGQVVGAVLITLFASVWSLQAAMIATSAFSLLVAGTIFLLGYGRAKLARR